MRLVCCHVRELLLSRFYAMALEKGFEDVLKIYGNRSLVRARRRMWNASLKDADRCMMLAPDWAKGTPPNIDPTCSSEREGFF